MSNFLTSYANLHVIYLLTSKQKTLSAPARQLQFRRGLYFTLRSAGHGGGPRARAGLGPCWLRGSPGRLRCARTLWGQHRGPGSSAKVTRGRAPCAAQAWRLLTNRKKGLPSAETSTPWAAPLLCEGFSPAPVRFSGRRTGCCTRPGRVRAAQGLQSPLGRTPVPARRPLGQRSREREDSLQE